MCGVAGYFQKENHINQGLDDKLNKMIDSIEHRGPDANSCWFSKNYSMGLGHARLSIIDLSEKAKQPMISSSGRYVISYNGEVYNFQVLKKEISVKKNIEWKSNSDTEVILEAIELWGLNKALNKINGIFAFAIFDTFEKKLFLARDRFGVKPLYYKLDNGHVNFCSELKGIVSFQEKKPHINHNSVINYLKYSYISYPDTIYDSIFQIDPGCIISFDGNLKFKKNYYWSAIKQAKISKGEQFKFDKENIVDKLDKILNITVKKQMVSDVPLGSFLSGGIDSSLITSIMQNNSSSKINTFSIGFSELKYNEAHHAKKIAEYLGTNHTEFIVKPKELSDLIYQLPDIYDEPFADSSQLPTYLLSKLTSNHVTVALSGDGGDEIFSGYNRYIWANILKNYSIYCPKIVRGYLSSFTNNISDKALDKIYTILTYLLPGSFKSKNPSANIKKFINLSQIENNEKLYDNFLTYVKDPEEILNQGLKYEYQSNLFENLEDFEFIEKMMIKDTIGYMTNDILCKVDRASMANSLEVRVPFIDENVFNFAWKIPLRYKNSNLKGKIILKNLLTKYLPVELYERGKMGFGVPIDDWIRGSLRELFHDVLSEQSIKRNNILKYEKVNQLMNQHSKGLNLGNQIWVVFILHLWIERWR